MVIVARASWDVFPGGKPVIEIPGLVGVHQTKKLLQGHVGFDKLLHELIAGLGFLVLDEFRSLRDGFIGGPHGPVGVHPVFKQLPKHRMRLAHVPKALECLAIVWILVVHQKLLNSGQRFVRGPFGGGVVRTALGIVLGTALGIALGIGLAAGITAGLLGDRSTIF